jgi:DNA-binding NarL/FixJ family response regulator
VIRTFVAAQSALARAGLADAVRSDARLTFAGESAVDELERALAAVEPDVLLEARTDPERGGARRLEFARPFVVPTVMLVDDPREAWPQAIAEEGASPFALLAADASRVEIVAAIVAVAAGLVAVPPAAFRAPSKSLGGERLTPREIDVLGELARGIPNKTIAAHLAISEHTVKFHVASIFAKLGAASRTEAVAQGVRLGLIML